jgi:hypothetical protein
MADYDQAEGFEYAVTKKIMEDAGFVRVLLDIVNKHVKEAVEQLSIGALRAIVEECGYSYAVWMNSENPFKVEDPVLRYMRFIQDTAQVHLVVTIGEHVEGDKR